MPARQPAGHETEQERVEQRDGDGVLFGKRETQPDDHQRHGVEALQADEHVVDDRKGRDELADAALLDNQGDARVGEHRCEGQFVRACEKQGRDEGPADAEDEEEEDPVGQVAEPGNNPVRVRLGGEDAAPRDWRGECDLCHVTHVCPTQMSDLRFSPTHRLFLQQNLVLC